LVHHNFTLPTLLTRLLEKAREVAPVTTTDDERFDALYEFAAEARAWLDQQPAPVRETVLETLELYRRTGDAPGMPIPQDAREKQCFYQLLALVREPPPLFL
jgi:hypothetical protein